MKKLLFTFVVLVSLSFIFAANTYSQTLPDHPNCHTNAHNCWGKIYTTHVGERTFQEISFLLKPVKHLSETIEIEVNGLIYRPEGNQGSFTIEADKIETAFFKILDVDSHIVYAAEWTYVNEEISDCVTLHAVENENTYLVLTAGYDIITANETYSILSQTFVTSLGIDPQYTIRETVSGAVVQCKSLAQSPMALNYEMTFNLFVPLVQSGN